MCFWMGFVDATHRELIERTWKNDDDDDDDVGAGGIKASANIGRT